MPTIWTSAPSWGIWKNKNSDLYRWQNIYKTASLPPKPKASGCLPALSVDCVVILGWIGGRGGYRTGSRFWSGGRALPIVYSRSFSSAYGRGNSLQLGPGLFFACFKPRKHAVGVRDEWSVRYCAAYDLRRWFGVGASPAWSRMWSWECSWSCHASFSPVSCRLLWPPIIHLLCRVRRRQFHHLNSVRRVRRRQFHHLHSVRDRWRALSGVRFSH